MVDLSVYVDGFLDSLRYSMGRSENTVQNYAVDLAQFLEYLQGEGVNSASLISTNLVRAFVRNSIGYGFSKTSTARKLSSIRGFLEYLVGKGELEQNPSVGLRSPKRPERLPRALSQEDTLRLIEDGPSGRHTSRDRLFMELMYGSGLRVSEVAGLMWSDVDTEERWLRVEGKGEKTRNVPMGPLCCHMLTKWKKDSRQGPVFPGEGKAVCVSERTICRAVVQAAKSVGLHGVSPHTLRHCFATHMLEHGAPLRAVQEMLGHESLATTQIYLDIGAHTMKTGYEKAHPRAGG